MGTVEFTNATCDFIREVEALPEKGSHKTRLKRRLDSQIASILKFYDANAGWTDQARFLGKVVTLFPRDASYSIQYAKSLMFFGRYEEARNCLQKVRASGEARELLSQLDLFLERTASLLPESEEIEKIACIVERMNKAWLESQGHLDEAQKQLLRPMGLLKPHEFADFITFAEVQSSHLLALA